MSKHSSTPKDIFLRLFHIVVFYLMVTSFITILIQYVNALFPDALYFNFDSISQSIILSTSILVISTPAYLLSAWFLQKDIDKTPQKRDLKIVKWFVYLTLFISAITIIIDLITFVYNFLNGELSTQFLLKMLIVLLVAVAVFGYFLWELKRTDAKSHTPKILAWVLSSVITLCVIAGFMIIGTPSQQRARRFDNQRTSDLQMLQSEIVNYWTQKQKLPVALTDLQDSISGFTVPVDPETKNSYQYKATEPLTFSLCATFVLQSDKYSNVNQNMYAPYGQYQQNWSHGAEETCFERTIDPDLYKGNLGTKPLIR